jgi:hypothetical protein
MIAFKGVQTVQQLVEEAREKLKHKPGISFSVCYNDVGGYFFLVESNGHPELPMPNNLCVFLINCRCQYPGVPLDELYPVWDEPRIEIARR